MQKYFELLGFRAKDIVSGFEGVVTSIDFDLYGCIQGCLQSSLDKEGNPAKGFWFDLKRLRKTPAEPVMPVPDFVVVPGGAVLPDFEQKPDRY